MARKPTSIHYDATPAVEAAGQHLAQLVDGEMDEDLLMQRRCEQLGRSVKVVRAERDRILKSRIRQ
jgi:hypothetical protein